MDSPEKQLSPQATEKTVDSRMEETKSSMKDSRIYYQKRGKFPFLLSNDQKIGVRRLAERSESKDSAKKKL